jgi:DNA-binding transcriptional MerR regulator
MANPVMLTSGEIARRLGQPIHRIEYVLRTRKIPAKATAGNCRVYDESDVERIREILNDIASKKAGVP